MTETGTRYRFLFSEAISSSSLKAHLEALREKYSGLHLEAWVADRFDSIELVGHKLRSLTGLSQVSKPVSIRSCALGTFCDAQFEDYCRFCDRNAFPGWSITWKTLEAMGTPERDGVTWCCDLSLSAGLANDGYWTKLLVSSDSELRKDRDRRRAAFEKAIRLWGLEDQLRVETREGDFLIIPSPPLKLRYLENWPGNLNPTDLRVSGLSSLEQAIRAAKAARDGLSAQILEAVVGCYPNLEQYGQVYKHFNDAHQGWHIEVWGTITAEAEAILNGGEIGDSSPPWIPAFRWWEEDICAKVFGSIVIDNGERYLEIATDGGTLELLQERVAFLGELRFESVFPENVREFNR